MCGGIAFPLKDVSQSSRELSLSAKTKGSDCGDLTSDGVENSDNGTAVGDGIGGSFPGVNNGNLDEVVAAINNGLTSGSAIINGLTTGSGLTTAGTISKANSDHGTTVSDGIGGSFPGVSDGNPDVN